MSRALLAVPAAAFACVLLAGCGGSAATPTVYTSPPAPKYVRPAGQHFQSSNSKTIGTIVVHKRSVLTWATDGPVFQLWDAGQRIRVRTQDHGGHLKLGPGTYKKVSVIAFGNWLVTITPG
jgi:hypothetical protein